MGTWSLEYVKRYGSTVHVAAHYQYGVDGQLSTATHGNVTDTMTWDGLGNRTSLTVVAPDPSHPGQTISKTYGFVYDVTAGVPAVLEEDRPDGVKVQYYRTPGGRLIASRSGTTGDPTSYYHFDAQGSTRLITGANGAVRDTYAYDPYGKVIAHYGPTTDNPYKYVGALGYYTHWQDPEIRLLQLGFRFYDSETGRFTQRDPIRAGINWYAYGGVDPWGLKCNCGHSSATDSGPSWGGEISRGFGIGWDAMTSGVAFTSEEDDWSPNKYDPSYRTSKILGNAASVVFFVAALADVAQSSASGRQLRFAWSDGQKLGGEIESATGPCFVAGTLVATPDGQRAIQEIRDGDLVWSYDDSGKEAELPAGNDQVQLLDADMRVGRDVRLDALREGDRICFHGRVYYLTDGGVPGNVEPVDTKVVSARVGRTFVRQTDTRVDLKLRLSDGSDSVVTGTPEHPFYVPGAKSYVAMGKLTAGTVLMTADGGVVTVVGSTSRHGSCDVYNFEVAGRHNYYVSDSAVLVHNECTRIAEEMQSKLGGQGQIIRVQPSLPRARFVDADGFNHPDWRYHDVLLHEGRVYDPMMQGKGNPWVDYDTWVQRWDLSAHNIGPKP